MIGATVIGTLVVVGAMVIARGRGGPAAAPASATSAAPFASAPAPVGPISSSAALPPLAPPSPYDAGLAAPPALPLREAAQSEHVQEPELVNVPRITAVELLARMGRGDVAVIDVRDIESYRVSHIPGALHIPLSFIDGELPYLPRDKMIVAYCT